jgi:hypothetical protein
MTFSVKEFVLNNKNGLESSDDGYALVGKLSSQSNDELKLTDKDDPSYGITIRDSKLIKAIASNWWPFKNDIYCLTYCDCNNVGTTIEITKFTSICVHFPAKSDSQYIEIMGEIDDKFDM